MTKDEITEAVARDLWQARQARLPAYVRDESWTWERALALSKEFSDMGPAQDVLDALEDAQAALSAVSQAGYAVVPVEATMEMGRIGLTAHVNIFGKRCNIEDALEEANSTPDLIGVAYRAMVSAGRVDGGVDAQEDS